MDISVQKRIEKGALYMFLKGAEKRDLRRAYAD